MDRLKAETLGHSGEIEEAAKEDEPTPEQPGAPTPREEQVDEASEDSFPASDPPSWSGTTTAGDKASD